MAAEPTRTPLAVVAAEAGVSVPTVSKVLNMRPDVSGRTRARVTEVLERHGYALRPPSARPTGMIDVRIVDFEGTWSEAVVRGAVAGARRLGLDVVLAVEPDPDDCSAWVRHALERGTDGLVSIVAVPDAEARRALEDTGTPLVVVDPRQPPPAGMLSVGATNFQGGLEATAHLLALGHTRIATITGALEQDNAIARLAGYRAAMIRAGLTTDDELVHVGSYGVTSGYEGARRLLALDDPPTAIFASSDDTALGALRALREAGLSVPRDVSLVGFDDLPVAPWIDPALTTVRQPLAEMGATAVDLVHRARTASGHTLRTELATSLVLRDSTAPPPA
ncbi:LacI family DNA-binding transcriptional regulator [Promicromonospora citrea]|uniref:LacI family transcriptional regulator n=1 Tax=Promicromonospora citrea TaxID=43677 RepID=A0A8H9L6V9_9MICO|nr:LacI family DNA-binding transcriptional regulator [Promicromonospora citrea]NNH52155.1 LacI family DNA-binding transcriptional regulator [Promicromonospora citrea]GGM37441.1 LacI family transcriptional regulator [Promicromonospora citrea]